MWLLISLCILPFTSSYIFVYPPVRPNPAVQKYTGTESTSFFNLKLAVGDKKNRMPINGLTINLEDDIIPKRKHLSMPGANGPSPQISSGVRSLSVAKDAGFVDMFGFRKITLSDGCWEINWRDGSPAGSLVCAFNCPESVRRKSYGKEAASSPLLLPSGRIYISFPIWTRDSLAESQDRKEQILKQIAKQRKSGEEEMEKMYETRNLLMKALHYRNAFAAVEKAMMSGSSKMIKEVPKNSEIVSIKDDLLLCTKGTVWTKKDVFLGSTEHVLLGYAVASPTIDPSLES